jgi:hypothetical protein
MRALDRIGTAQLAAAELLVYTGLPEFRIAQRLALPVETVRRWMREREFIAAVNELARAYASGALVPLGLCRIRGVLSDPFAKPRDLISATRFAAEIAGLLDNGVMRAPEAGAYAPSTISTRAVEEMTADDLRRAMVAGVAAQERLARIVEADAEPVPNPLD